MILPQLPWSEQAQLWRRAEDYGFDHAWTYDHLTWDPLADEPWGATIPTLVAAATVTHRIELGPWVSSPNFRHPVPFARDLFGLDDVSGGRAVLAVGAGTPRRDGRVLGTDAAGGPDLEPAVRAARLEEFVALLDLVMRQRHTDFDGRFYHAVDATTIQPGRAEPGRPPFVIAANGPRLMRFAVRAGDGWCTTGPAADDEAQWWSRLAGICTRFDEAVAEVTAGAGQLPDGYRRMLSADTSRTLALSSAAHFEDVAGRVKELGFTDVVVPWPRRSGKFSGLESVLDDVAALLPGLR